MSRRRKNTLASRRSVVATVCTQCPFRRESAPGYLGGNDADSYATAATTDASVGCHLQAEDDNPDSFYNAPRCRGALIMRANQCKLPRDKDWRKVAEDAGIECDTVVVFRSQWEFVAHHKQLTT